MRCRKNTLAGKRCRRLVIHGKRTCYQHHQGGGNRQVRIVNGVAQVNSRIKQYGGDYNADGSFKILQWNIMDHNDSYINQLGRKERSVQYVARYVKIIDMITGVINEQGVDIIFLEEVPRELKNMVTIYQRKVNHPLKNYNAYFCCLVGTHGLLSLIHKNIKNVVDLTAEFEGVFTRAYKKWYGNKLPRTQIFVIDDKYTFVHVHLPGGTDSQKQEFRQYILYSVTRFVRKRPSDQGTFYIGDFNISPQQSIPPASSSEFEQMMDIIIYGQNPETGVRELPSQSFYFTTPDGNTSYHPFHKVPIKHNTAECPATQEIYLHNPTPSLWKTIDYVIHPIFAQIKNKLIIPAGGMDKSPHVPFELNITTQRERLVKCSGSNMVRDWSPSTRVVFPDINFPKTFDNKFTNNSHIFPSDHSLNWYHFTLPSVPEAAATTTTGTFGLSSLTRSLGDISDNGVPKKRAKLE